MSNSAETHEKWLPSGWSVQVRTRPTGQTDKHYFSPNGIRFNSKVKVCRYLETGRVGGVACSKRRKTIPVAQTEEFKLPSAWKVEIREKKSGKIYKVYVDTKTGYKFYSTFEVIRYLQNGELPRSGTRKKIVNLSSLDKVRKLAWNNKRRRSLFTGQSSNTTSVKNNELVLISTDIQCWEGGECYDDRRFLPSSSNINELESKQNATAYKEVIWAVPLSVYYPDNDQVVQAGIAKCGKRKTKSRPAKSQSKKEPVKKKPKPNPRNPKERIVPNRISRRLAGLEPEFFTETSINWQDFSVEDSTEVDTVPVTYSLGTEKGNHDLEENTKNVESGKSENEIRLELVSETTSGNHHLPVASPVVGNEDFPEDTVAKADDGGSINPLGIEEQTNSDGKTHEEEGDDALEENMERLESEIVACTSLLEGQETVTCIRKERKYTDGWKRKASARRGQAFRTVLRRFKVNVRDGYEKPSMPDRMEAIIKRLGGRYIERMADKVITHMDVKESQARLYLPIEFENFLSETEKNYLKGKPKKGLEVVVVDPKSKTRVMSVQYWHNIEGYVLIKNWPKLVKRNGIKAGEHVVEIWTFRQCLSLEEEVEDGNKNKGRLGIAVNLRRWELVGTSVASTSNGDCSGVSGSSGNVDCVSCTDALDSAMDGNADLCSSATNASDVVTMVDIGSMNPLKGEDMCSLDIGVKEVELGMISEDEGVKSVEVNKRMLESGIFEVSREPVLASEMTKSNQDVMTSAEGGGREGRHSLGIEGKVIEVRFKPQLGPQMSNRTPDVPAEASLQLNSGGCFRYLGSGEEPTVLQKLEMEERLDFSREREEGTQEGRHLLGFDGKLNEVHFELAPELSNRSQDVPVDVSIYYLGIDEQSIEGGKTAREKENVQLEKNTTKLESEKSKSVMRLEVPETRSSISAEANTLVNNEEGTYPLCIGEQAYGVGKTHEEQGDQSLENNTRKCESGTGSSEYAMNPEIPDIKTANNDTPDIMIAENDTAVEASGVVRSGEATQYLEKSREEENIKKPESKSLEFEMNPELIPGMTRGYKDILTPKRSGKSNVLEVAHDRLPGRPLAINDWLPPGWKVEFRKRKNDRGVDKYYIDPASGFHFRSRNEVSRYLEDGVLPTKAGRKRWVTGTELSSDQVVLGLECRERRDESNSNGNHIVAKLDTREGIGKEGNELRKTPENKGDQFVDVNTRKLEHGRPQIAREHDPWKTYAEEYTRKLQSKKVGTVIRLPFRQSPLDSCVEFANKALAGLIPIEHLPLNLVHEW